MFFSLARAMSFEEYGKFAFGFSLALVLAKAATVGQPQLLLRLLPGTVAFDTTWRTVLRYTLRNVLIAGCLASLVLVAFGVSEGAYRYILAAAPLCILLSLSEFQSALLRARNRIAWAIAPREVIWRGMVVALALVFWISGQDGLTAAAVFGFSSLFLALVLVLQTRTDKAVRYGTSLSGDTHDLDPTWARISRRFWLTSLVIFGTPNLSVVIVGAVLDVADSGPFFAALKTAQLMQLVLMAANIVTMPLISKYHKARNTDAIQAICTTVSLAAGLVALFGLVIIWVFGVHILRLYGAGFEVAWAEMVALGIGFAVSGMNGPNGPALNMTGHEAKFGNIILISNGLGLVSLVPAVYFFGSIGAACVVSGSMIVWNVWARSACQRLTGVDPSIIGVFKRGWT
ncbi:MAG: lipopolysaccharide biosynthesis protein [Pseudomonadota bacterium]